MLTEAKRGCCSSLGVSLWLANKIMTGEHVGPFDIQHHDLGEG